MHQIKKRIEPLHKHQRVHLKTHRQALQMKQKTYSWHAEQPHLSQDVFMDLLLCSEKQETLLCLLAIFFALKSKGWSVCSKLCTWRKNARTYGVCGFLVGNDYSKNTSGAVCILQHSRSQSLMGLPDKRFLRHGRVRQ